MKRIVNVEDGYPVKIAREKHTHENHTKMTYRKYTNNVIKAQLTCIDTIKEYKPTKYSTLVQVGQ